MPPRRIPQRDNSLSDEDGVSLTSDEEEFAPPASPRRSVAAAPPRTSTGERSLPPADPLPATDVRRSSRHIAREGTTGTNATNVSAARERFRTAVRKVIHMHRTSTRFLSREVGAEPGVDPRRNSAFQQYGHLKQRCVIEVCDYSTVRHNFGRMSNETFVEYMQDPKANKMEDWVRVRWINIGGISWDVISALALRYDLHPLAIEDVLHRPRSGLLSKADYYVKHLFLRVLAHSIPTAEEHEPLLFDNPVLSYENEDDSLTGLPRSTSPTNFSDGKYADGSEDENAGLPEGLPQKSRTSSVFKRRAKTDLESKVHDNEQLISSARFSRLKRSTAKRNRVRHARAIEELKAGDRVDVRIQPFCIFLLRDGTVITLQASPNVEFTAPIRERLKHRDTGLRSSADPSLLVHAVLDLIVDRSLEIVDEYHAKIVELEHKVLIHPNMKTVRDLHIVQADLATHKRTLEPVKTVVYGLRRYDKDRVAALVADEDRDPDAPVKGFMSHKAKVYLADVVDHMNYVLASVETFSETTGHLIDYTFNMSSYQMNEGMRRLTLVTIIFLPLTLLTGYFGMNFDPMWAVQQNSDALFWKIAAPVMFVVITVFCWHDIWRMWYHFKNRMVGKRIKREEMTRRKHH